MSSNIPSEREYMNKYLHENILIKKKTKRFYIRERKPFEIFGTEILVILLILFMLIMLYVNYQSNLNYMAENNTTEEKEIKEIDVGVDINKDTNLESSAIIKDKFFSGNSFFT
jgi:hypothetical protein